jgi:hypothetical protein
VHDFIFLPSGVVQAIGPAISSLCTLPYTDNVLIAFFSNVQNFVVPERRKAIQEKMSAIDSSCYGVMIGMAKREDTDEQEIKSVVHGVQRKSSGVPDKSAFPLLQQVLMEILYLNTVDKSSLPCQLPSLRRLHMLQIVADHQDSFLYAKGTEVRVDISRSKIRLFVG